MQILNPGTGWTANMKYVHAQHTMPSCRCTVNYNLQHKSKSVMLLKQKSVKQLYSYEHIIMKAVRLTNSVFTTGDECCRCTPIVLCTTHLLGCSCPCWAVEPILTTQCPICIYPQNKLLKYCNKASHYYVCCPCISVETFGLKSNWSLYVYIIAWFAVQFGNQLHE